MSNKQPPSGDTIRVTVVPEVNQFQFSHEDGSPLIGVDGQPMEPVEPPKYGAAALHMERLAAVIMGAGPGEHPVTDIRNVLAQSGLEGAESTTTAGVSMFGRQLNEYMPQDVVTYRPKGESSFTVGSLTLGNLALTSRAATPEERTAFAERLLTVEDPEQLYNREQLIAEEEGKIDLSAHDHALVDFNDERFVIALDSQHGVIATRVVQALSSFTGKNFDLPGLVTAVWKTMPLAERLMVTQDEAKLYTKSGGAITKLVKGVVDQFTGRLLMTRRGGTANLYLLSKQPITVELEAEPPERPYPLTIRRVFPPGTHRDELKVRPPEPLTDEELTYGRELAAWSQATGWSKTSITQEYAVDVLDFIMRDNGKRALREALGENPSKGALRSILNRLHGIVRCNLGNYSYYIAYNDRVGGKRYGLAYGARGQQPLKGQLTDKWAVTTAVS